MCTYREADLRSAAGQDARTHMAQHWAAVVSVVERRARLSFAVSARSAE
jgi:hypothetical protein